MLNDRSDLAHWDFLLYGVYSARGRKTVMLLELLHKDEAEIAKVGVKAIEQAHAAGVAAYYIDISLGDGIVKEMPDGTRQLIDSNMDEDVVLQILSPGR